jgi:hypothetical protein
MAPITSLEHERKKQRRLAMLALLSHQTTPAGDCLGDEELAALVEERLAPEERERCLAHLAGCDRCLGMWLALDREHHSRRSRWQSLKLQMRRPRMLTAIGSALAAAASIAVFLSLTTQVDRSVVSRREATLEQLAPPPSSPSAILQDQADAPPAASSLGEGRKDTVAQRAIPAEPATVKKKESGLEQQRPRAARSAVPVPPGVEEKQTTDNVVPGAGAGEAATRRAAAPPPAAEPEAACLPSVEEWRDRIRALCAGRSDRRAQAALVEQGRRLLAESSSLDAGQRRQIEAVVNLLAGGQPVEHQCQSVLDLLAPAAEKRGP